MNDQQDKAVGAIMGTLIGDALGVGPHWYYDLDQLKRDYGEWIDNYTAPKPNRFHAGLQAGENSQTGQVTTFLLESVAECGAYSETDFTDRLDALLEKLDGTPKGGRYTDHAMRDVYHGRQTQGMVWSEAGSFADTAEAAIRTPVLAAHYSGNMEELVQCLRSNVVLTHRDPFIAGQSVSFGLIVAGLIEGNALGHVHQWVMKSAKESATPLVIHTPPPDGDTDVSFTDALLQAGWSCQAARDASIQIEPASSACRLFGMACTLGFLLPAAYYFVGRFENDFYGAVMPALNGGGNNMARAALTGALAGAQVGLSGIPEYLIEGLDDHEHLIDMAREITK